MKFRPLHDRVVVKRLDGEEKTASGIIIPDSAQEKPMRVKLSQLVMALVMRQAKLYHLMLNQVILFYLVNGQVQK